MTRAECLEFLQVGTRTGKLATVKANGEPHCVPIWFVIDGDELLFMTMSTTVKAKNIARQPKVMICIDQESFPYDFVTVVGAAHVQDLSPEEMLPYSTRIAERYVGADHAEEFGHRNAVPDEVLVRVRIDRFLSAKSVAGVKSASQYPPPKEIVMRFRRLVPYFRVNDMHRSIAFYRDALGFQTVETIGEGEDLFWAQLQRDEVSIMVSLGFIEILGTKGAEVTDPALHREGRTNDHGTTRDRLGNEYLNVSTYLYVDDADELYGQILRAGYATLTEPEDQEYGIRSFHVEDPDGYVLSIAHLLGDD